jgi:hypothetical protein
MMMEHLKSDEIEKMPLHMQVLYYLEQWGKIERKIDPNKKPDSAKYFT